VTIFEKTRFSRKGFQRQLRWAFGLCTCLSLANRASAQGHTTVSGVVLDQRGDPISSAEVSLREVRLLIRTDSAGAFAFPDVRDGPITIDVRRLGYVPSSTSVVVPQSRLRLTLEQAPATLAGVTANRSRYRGLEDFQRRRQSGVGLFVTRADIEARRPTRLSDVLRSLPGVRIEKSGRASILRFSAVSNHRRDCVPQYWVDGQHVRGAEIDDFPPNDIEAVELYSGPAKTPLQFSAFGGVTTCGAVVIWSRPTGG
jgi:Carboxypeptidase regulatory-like domain/TonB-dependent Receptor Plug Domain